MQNRAFGLPSAYADPNASVDEAEILRRQQIADMLRQQSMIPTGRTQMAGNIAIRNSPLEGIAKVFSAYMANRNDEETGKLRTELSERRAKEMAASVDNLFGDSGQPSVVQNPQSMRPQGVPRDAMVAGGFPQPQDAPPPANNQAEDVKRRAKAALLMGNKDLANKLLANLWEQTPAMKDMAFKGMDPKAVGQAEMDKLRADARMNVSQGSTVLGPDNQPVFTAPMAPTQNVREITEALTAAGIDPKSPQGQQAFAQFVSKQATHQPAASTQVTLNTEKGYAGNIAAGLAGQDLSAIDIGKAAPDRILSARRIKDALDKNPITGTGAELRLGLDKALSTAGLIDPKQTKATEDLASYLAAGTLDAIKSSGLGSGQGFTDKDRQFLEKAKSGNISINPGTLRTLADLNERSALAAIDKANGVIRKLKKNPNMGGVGTDLDEITPPGAVNPVDAILNKYLPRR